MIIKLVWYRRLFNLVMITGVAAVFASVAMWLVSPLFYIILVPVVLVATASAGLFTGYHFGWCDGYRDYKRINEVEEDEVS